jgi:hypothetical protein
MIFLPLENNEVTHFYVCEDLEFLRILFRQSKWEKEGDSPPRVGGQV